MRSWVPHADASVFPLRHLPLGVRRRPDGSHAAVAPIGHSVADLRVLAEIGLFDDCGPARGDFAEPTLNALLRDGPHALAKVRARLRQCLGATPTYYDLRDRREIFLLPRARARLTPPLRVGDLAWVGPHRPAPARASSLLPDGAEVPRPPSSPADGALTATAVLAFVIAGGTRFGRRLDASAAETRCFGVSAGLCFRASGTPPDAAPYATVLANYVTPLDAFGTPELTLSHTPYRRPGARVAGGRPGGVLAQAARAIAELTRGGARLCAGDVFAVELPALSRSGLVDGDTVRLSPTGDTGPAEVHATVVAPLP